MHSAIIFVVTFIFVFAPTISAAAAKTAEIDVSEGTWMNLDVSPDNRLIVFDLLGDIFLLDRATGNTEQLLGGSAYEAQPKFSPDGKYIAYMSDRSGADNIWIMTLDGRKARQLSNESLRKASGPAWSPDGRTIAARKHYTASRSVGAGEIWMYDVATGESRVAVERQSTQKAMNEPAFSPDGAYLYFSRDLAPGDSFQYDRDPHSGIIGIERKNLKTGDVEPFLFGPGGAMRPTPSPDGKKVAYVTRADVDAEGYSSALMVRDLESGATDIVESRLDQDGQELWANHGFYPAFSWTPDSRSLVFWARGKIWEKYIAGGAAEEIPFRVETSFDLVEPPRFPLTIEDEFDVKVLSDLAVSPDGKVVAFEALGRIHVRDLSSTTNRRLTKTNGEPGRIETDPAFSPDGAWITYATWHDDSFGDIRRTRLSDGETVVLTQRRGHFASPAVTPDGQSIVYTRHGGGYLLDRRWTDNPGAYMVDWDGGEEKRVHDATTKVEFCGRDSRHFYVTKDRVREDSPPASYWLKDKVVTRVEIASGDETPIAAVAFGNPVRISKDCRRIAYADRGTIKVASIAGLRGGAIIPEARNIEAPGDGGYDLAWSGDNTLYWSLGPTLSQWSFTKGRPNNEPKRQAIGFSADRVKPEGVTALKNARIVTMRGDEIIKRGTILIAQNRITAVGRKVDIPDDAKVFNLKGRAVTPGFIDNHWHGLVEQDGSIPNEHWPFRSTLSFGVTTIFDPYTNPPRALFSASERANAGRFLAPRIYSTGAGLYGAENEDTVFINNLEDARREIRRRTAYGAIAVKSYLIPRRDQRQWVVEAARLENVFVAAEASMATIQNASQIMDGETSIEHAMSLTNIYDDVRSLWVQSDIDTVPTMVIGLGGIGGEMLFYNEGNVWKHPILSRHAPVNFLRAQSARRTRVSREDISILISSRWLNDLQKTGLRVLPGGHGQREGLGLHWELWLMAEGGRTPMSILQAATIQGAEHLGLEKELGSIEPGKLADLIVFDKDPTRDIRNTDDIRYVVANGQVLDPFTLERVASDD